MAGAVTYGTKAARCLAGHATPGSGALSVLGNTQYCYDDRGNRVRRIDNVTPTETITYTPYKQVREVYSSVMASHTTRGRNANGYDVLIGKPPMVRA